MLSLLALAALAVASEAQSSTFIYTLRDNGGTFVNGTLLEKAPSLYVSGDGGVHGEQQYIDLAVVGNDRYQLRVDGLVRKNGVKLHELGFSIGSGPFWFRMHVPEDGIAHLLRTDGMVVRNGQVMSTHAGFGFADLTTVPTGVEGEVPDVYALRVDGSIFRQGSLFPGFRFDYDKNPDFPEDDGSFLDGTQWLHLMYDAEGDLLLAMRADGVIFSADPAAFSPIGAEEPGDGGPLAPPNGTLVAELPFNNGVLYSDIALRSVPAVDPGGVPSDWFALRLDGRVFSSTQAPPGPDGDWEFVLNLPGDGVSNSEYTSIMPVQDDVFVMRRNGMTYSGQFFEEQGKELFDVTSNGLVRMALSADPPDGSKFKNKPPKAVIYKTKVITDEAVVIPVLVADTDLPSAEIVLTPELDEEGNFPKLPNATWDPEAREVTFLGSPEKGSFRFRVFADDGSGKKPRRFTYPVKVLPPDAKPDKNKPPVPSKITKMLAFIDQELKFPILATDKDVGDVLTIETIDLKGKDIFDPDYGAVFDDVTNTVTWTPTFAHLGKHRAKFLITDDGDPQRSRKLVVVIEVVSQLELSIERDEG
ncbi:MAG: hypothetical protein DRQ55_09200 [Planctomycetota bacterium]|nr:MAG: hypothetical protein DRQ55_09200 [Planctomycetota bacterium]